jgi:hypothetical protein
MTRPLAFLMLAVTLAVAPAAPRLKELERSPMYYPTQKGTKGVFAEGQIEHRWEVSSSEQKGEETIVTITWEFAGKTTTYQKVSVSAKGLYRLGIREFEIEPYCMLKFPVKTGEKWEYQFARQPPGLRGEWGTVTVEAVEEVTVPAGKFNAVRVEMVVSQVNGAPLEKEERFTYWYNPEVGLVKMTSNMNKSRILKSFTQPDKKD